MRRSRVTCCVMILGILCVTAAAQEAKSTHEPDPLLKDAGPQANDEARTLLQRALHLADLYNWQASRPYFSRAPTIIRGNWRQKEHVIRAPWSDQSRSRSSANNGAVVRACART